MQPEKSKRRIYITGFLVAGIACFFVFKLFTLHFSDRIRIPGHGSGHARRGYILDRNGYIMAMSVEKESLFANPMKIEKPEEVAERIAPILGMAKDVIVERLGRQKRFVWLKRRMEEGEAAKIRALNIPGLQFRKELHRVYPHGSLGANIIGFVGLDNSGLAGIEYKFNSMLSGKDDERRHKNNEDRIITGNHITLTIDRFIQYQSEAGIEETVKAFNARQGMVLVLEVKTGRILAVAKYPGFDPNYYYQFSDNERGNYTVTDSFEPGSTLKIIALATLLELFPNFNRQFQCRGEVTVADTTINCIDTHGTVGLADIARYSCNAGMIQAMRYVKKVQYYRMLRRFGFGARTGIELPGESEGLLRPLGEWSGLSKYSLAIGQEISVTSLQLAAAFGAIGNGGVYMVPSIIESIEDDNGAVLQSFYARSKGRVISRATAQKLMSMMRLVMERGTGARARIRFYVVVGKTGTGQKSVRQRGYSERATASFIGLAPYDNPEICILVVVDEPAGGAGGGSAAAPVFAKVAERVLPYLGVKNPVVTRGGAIRNTVSPVVFDGTHLPDFRGMTLADSLRALVQVQKRFHITYSLHGKGRVVSQQPLPGKAVGNNEKIKLYLQEQ